MKIVHIISSLERGGAQVVLHMIATARAHSADEQIVCYFHDGPYRTLLHDAGIATYKISGFFAPYDFLGIYRFSMLLKQFKPDLIHSLLWSANWVARMCARWYQIPCIISLHNNYDQNGIMRNWIDAMNSFKQCSIVAVSAQVQDSFYAHQSYAHEINVIENGIAPIAHSAAINRQAMGIADDEFVIGSVGRLVPVKRYDCLLNAFALIQQQHAKSRLLIVGSGPLEENLRAYAQKIGVADRIIWISNSAASPYYALFDSFVLCSSKEGISIAMLEAMSAGVPCIVAGKKREHPVIINGQTGIVAQGENATDFANGIRMLIDDAALRNKIAFSSQRVVAERFSKERMIAAYNHLFHALMQHKVTK